MRKNFGTLLVEAGLITQKVLEEALQRQVIFGGRLGTNLIEMGSVKEEDVLKLLASQHNVPYAEGRHFDNLTPQVLQSVPRDLLEKHRIVPLAVEKTRITLAMRDPSRLDIVDEVAFQTGKTIRPVIASELRITHALEHYYDIKREARYIVASPEVAAEQRAVAGPRPSPQPEEAADVVEIHEAEIEALDPLDMEQINQSFFSISTRDDVAQTLVRAALRVMDDVFTFIIKGDDALGWMAGGTIQPPVDFGRFELRLNSGSLIDSVRESRALERWVGAAAVPGNPWLQSLTRNVPLEIVACPLVLKKHVVAVMVGLSWKSRIDDKEAEFIVRVMRKASVAFEILILKSRIVML